MSDIPMVSGIIETTLYVCDLVESRKFYQRIFGFHCLLEDHRMCALQVPGCGVLLLFKRDGSLQPSRVRQAFGGISLYFRDPDGHSVEVATPGLWANY